MTTAADVASGTAMAVRHRYLSAENTLCQVTITSDTAVLAPQGFYGWDRNKNRIKKGDSYRCLDRNAKDNEQRHDQDWTTCPGEGADQTSHRSKSQPEPKRHLLSWPAFFSLFLFIFPK